MEELSIHRELVSKRPITSPVKFISQIDRIRGQNPICNKKERSKIE